MAELFKEKKVSTKTLKDILEEDEHSQVSPRLIRGILENAEAYGLKGLGDLERKDFHTASFFESLDGYQIVESGTGSVSLYGNGQNVQLQTGGTTGGYGEIKKRITYEPIQFSWDKNRMFHTRINLYDVSQMKAWIGTGYSGSPNLDASLEWIGYVIEDKKLYARVHDGNGNATQIEIHDLDSGWNWPDAILDLKIRLIAGNRAEFDWWCNEEDILGYYRAEAEDVDIIRTNLPTGDSLASYMFIAKIENKEDNDKQLKFSYWDIWQQS